MCPAVIEAFEAGELAETMPASRRRGLKTDEAALAIFLESNGKGAAAQALETVARKISPKGCAACR